MINRTNRQPSLTRLTMLLLTIGAWCAPASAQNASHPDAKPELPDNPYISFRDPWRWDIKSQLFLKSAVVSRDNLATPGRSINEEVVTTLWTPGQIELVFPVVREGGFYWSPNQDIEAEIRLDDVGTASSRGSGRAGSFNFPDQSIDDDNLMILPKFVQGNDAEYSTWQSWDINGEYRQLHLEHTSHIVCADSVFNDQLARQLPWPEHWEPRFAAYLTPVVDTVGQPIPDSAADTIDRLVRGWIGEDTDPRDGVQLDVVKYLTGKVIEHFTVRGQATEFPRQSTGGGSRPSLVVSANTWGGFIVRPANVIANNPQGSRFDLATLLTSVLRSAGVPARTVICINDLEPDQLLNTVALVEFAMHDPERDLTFWVPIDVDRVRLTGGRSSQFQRKWNYFGSHDELSHMIPISYYFHPPARYDSYDLPLLYGIRATGDSNRLPNYMIQSLLVDPIVTPATANDRRGND
ncbi:MAG: hypothetical protein KDA29_08685 [Phycisphaerales bacterium]|nr:hypothetical protein [Phycisphaerales bacterium]